MFPKNLAMVPSQERIFCNRSLIMSSIKAVGFDMDYTLAVYKHETFEKLAYDETLKKLVQMDYPQDLLKWKFDPKAMVRGLVVDKKLGNILKIDRHRYVKLAFHGFQKLSRDERRRLYDVENMPNYEEPNFALVDTIFSLAEAFLFSQLVDLKETKNKLAEKSFEQIYNDVRKAIDLSHRDGSIKDKIAQDPSKYIKHDPHLPSVLEDLHLSGRKVFLVTNSLWNYTNVVMNFILPTKHGSDKTWQDYFDLILTGSQKPNFFTSKNPLYEVHQESFLLKNLEVIPVLNKDEIGNKVFQGGHVKLLHDMLNIRKGSEILYIGDHIYGDILRSKKEIGWRTMLVVEELEKEIETSLQVKEKNKLCDELFLKKEQLSDELNCILLALQNKKKKRKRVHSKLETISIEEMEDKIKKLKIEIEDIDKYEEQVGQEVHECFHPVWGELMKTGRQNSRFFAQVFNYSCLYTSKVTNLRHYSLEKDFFSFCHRMPHEAGV
jgi:HAD superfamily 5'-nucleotidase-like hydrolase